MSHAHSLGGGATAPCPVARLQGGVGHTRGGMWRRGCARHPAVATRGARPPAPVQGWRRPPRHRRNGSTHVTCQDRRAVLATGTASGRRSCGEGTDCAVGFTSLSPYTPFPVAQYWRRAATSKPLRLTQLQELHTAGQRRCRQRSSTTGVAQPAVGAARSRRQNLFAEGRYFFTGHK